MCENVNITRACVPARRCYEKVKAISCETFQKWSYPEVDTLSVLNIHIYGCLAGGEISIQFIAVIIELVPFHCHSWIHLPCTCIADSTLSIVFQQGIWDIVLYIAICMQNQHFLLKSKVKNID
jgi:hypothetical protein